MNRLKSLARYALLALIFVVGCGLTLLATQRFRKPEAQPPPPNVETGDSGFGLSRGEVVSLPELSTLDGGRVSLGAAPEKYRLLAFVSTACPGCTQDAELWRVLAAEAHGRGTAFYLVAVDSDPSELKKFAAAYELEGLPLLFDPERRAAETFKIDFVPQYVLLTAGGKVVERWRGVRRYDPQQQGAEKVEQLFAPLAGQ